MKKILCTGSGGFVFSNFIRKALFDKLDYSFVSIDICKGPRVLNNIYVNKGHKFYIGDVADKHFIDVIFELERPDIVIHGAASDSKDSQELIHTNILGTQNIIEACNKWSVEKLIYCSTSEVYSKEIASVTEESSLAPQNLQAVTKLSGEFLVKNNHQVNYNIVRLGHNYGPRQQVEYFIPKAILSICNNEELIINENSNLLKDWTHVDDSYCGIITILEKGIKNNVYNISSNHEFSYLEVFQEICNILGRGHNLIKFVEGETEPEYTSSINTNKIKSLGWKPKVKLKIGLEQCVLWYSNNQWWFR